MSTGTVDDMPQKKEEETANAQVVPAHTVAPHADSPTEKPVGLRMTAVVAGIVLLLAIAYGLHIRSASEKQLVSRTEEAAIPTVNVVHPAAGSKARRSGASRHT